MQYSYPVLQILPTSLFILSPLLLPSFPPSLFPPSLLLLSLLFSTPTLTTACSCWVLCACSSQMATVSRCKTHCQQPTGGPACHDPWPFCGRKNAAKMERGREGGGERRREGGGERGRGREGGGEGGRERVREGRSGK